MPASTSSSSIARRRLRGFVRWMEARGIRYSDGLEFAMGSGNGIVCDEVGVRAVYDFEEGELIATIPKEACLTVRTTGAAEAIEEAQLGGGLGLAVALMYERSRGEASPWYPYLHLLPPRQADLPIVWEADEIDSLLLGTELHAVLHDDKRLIKEDWKECIWPLSEMNARDFPMEYFTLEHYFSAKTLVTSRAFQVDEFHGYGMVPLADLFNHKTGAEDVHFMNVWIDSDSDSVEGLKDIESVVDLEEEVNSSGYSRTDKMTQLESSSHLPSGDSSDSSEYRNGRSDVLQMILVKSISSGSEIFNTYGELSNAALLHRYGFTELENPHDIVNIDYTLVSEYCTLLFSKRYVRSRVRLWRKYGCTACISQNSEYFEILASGKPQLELLFLLYILHLSDDAFDAVDVNLDKLEADGNFMEASQWTDKVIATVVNKKAGLRDDEECKSLPLRGRHKSIVVVVESKEETMDFDEIFLTVEVCEALLWLCNRRDKAYGTKSVEEDLKLLEAVSSTKQPRLFNALSLRVSERCILRKLTHFISQTKKRLGNL